VKKKQKKITFISQFTQCSRKQTMHKLRAA